MTIRSLVTLIKHLLAKQLSSSNHMDMHVYWLLLAGHRLLLFPSHVLLSWPIGGISFRD